MKKALNIIYSIITALIIILAGYIMIFGAIARKNNEMLSIFGYSYSYVPTPSMKGTEEDSFDAHTLVITKRVKYEDINELDVIVFQSGHKLIIHRVMKINEDGTFTTKGDGNNAFDPNPVTPETYQAKMIKHFKFFKLGEKANDYQFIVLTLLIIVLIIYIIYQIFRLIIDIYHNKLKNKYQNNNPKE